MRQHASTSVFGEKSFGSGSLLGQTGMEKFLWQVDLNQGCNSVLRLLVSLKSFGLRAVSCMKITWNPWVISRAFHTPAAPFAFKLTQRMFLRPLHLVVPTNQSASSSVIFEALGNLLQHLVYCLDACPTSFLYAPGNKFAWAFAVALNHGICASAKTSVCHTSRHSLLRLWHLPFYSCFHILHQSTSSRTTSWPILLARTSACELNALMRFCCDATRIGPLVFCLGGMPPISFASRCDQSFLPRSVP